MTILSESVLTAAAGTTAEFGLPSAGCAASAAGAAGRTMGMAALSQQHNPAGMSTAVNSTLKDCLKQLWESAGLFAGVALNDIPASLFLTNYIAETGDRAQQCLSAAAGAAMQGDGAAAECSAVVCAVEGLLQLSVQPVAWQLFGLEQLQDLIRGLISCKQQLIDTLARISKT
jgi:hypothetical protein